MATGGGAVAGALIGTGVGIAAGVEVAGATTAAVEAGAVVEGANAACGGDMCASEVQDTSQAIQEALPAAEAESGTLQVFNSEAQGPISSYDVTVLGKNPDYIKLGNDLNAKILSDPDWTHSMQADFMQGVIESQDVVVASNPWPNTGMYGEEGLELISAGYKYSHPLFLPPGFGD